LNGSGEEVLKTVLGILSECDDLLGRDPKATQKVLIRIGVGPYMRDACLGPLMPRICHECPDVEIELHPMTSEAKSLQLTESGFIDLTVFPVTDPASERSVAQSVGELPMVAVAQPGTKQRLSSGEIFIEDIQFIFPLRRDIGARWAHSQLRSLNLFAQQPLLFVEFADLVADMVEEGQGISFLLAHTVSDRIASGHLEVLDFGLQPLRTVVVRSPKAPGIAKMVEKLLIECLQRDLSGKH
jgi:DNA-binding transcriptional LysR family regulator